MKQVPQFASVSAIRYDRLMTAEQFTRINRALADPRRMEILELIASQEEMACSALASDCPISQPTISHHVKELASAGLIKARKQAKYCFYRLDRKVWSEYLAESGRRVPAARNKKS